MHFHRPWAIMMVLATLGIWRPDLAQADLTPPGAKFVSHQVRFENLGDYPDTAFFLGWFTRFGHPEGKWIVRRLPASGEHGMHPPEGPPYHADTALAAVPVATLTEADAAGRPEWFLGKTPGVKTATLDVGLMRTAPVTDLRDTYWTVYRVGLTDSLVLTRVRHDVPVAASPSLILAAVALILAIAAGVTFWVRRRQRPSPA